MLPYAKEIFGCPFFWGDLDDNEAEEILAKNSNGSFLFRKSWNGDYLLGVSYKGNDDFHPFHHELICKLENSAGKFEHMVDLKDILDSNNYKNLPETCDFRKTLKIPIMRKNLFSLQELAICAMVGYGSRNHQNEFKFELPKRFQAFVEKYQCPGPWPRINMPRFVCEDTFLPDLERNPNPNPNFGGLNLFNYNQGLLRALRENN